MTLLGLGARDRGSRAPGHGQRGPGGDGRPCRPPAHLRLPVHALCDVVRHGVEQGSALRGARAASHWDRGRFFPRGWRCPRIGSSSPRGWRWSIRLLPRGAESSGRGTRAPLGMEPDPSSSARGGSALARSSRGVAAARDPRRRRFRDIQEAVLMRARGSARPARSGKGTRGRTRRRRRVRVDDVALLARRDGGVIPSLISGSPARAGVAAWGGVQPLRGESRRLPSRDPHERERSDANCALRTGTTSTRRGGGSRGARGSRMAGGSGRRRRGTRGSGGSRRCARRISNTYVVNHFGAPRLERGTARSGVSVRPGV